MAEDMTVGDSPVPAEIVTVSLAAAVKGGAKRPKAKRRRRQKARAREAESKKRPPVHSSQPSRKTMHSLALLAQHNPRALMDVAKSSADMREAKRVEDLSRKLQMTRRDFEEAMSMGEELAHANEEIKAQLMRLAEDLEETREREEISVMELQSERERHERDVEELYQEIDRLAQTVVDLENKLETSEAHIELATAKGAFPRALAMGSRNSSSGDELLSDTLVTTRHRGATESTKSLIRRLKEEEKTNNDLQDKVGELLDDLAHSQLKLESIHSLQDENQALSAQLEEATTERSVVELQLIEWAAMNAQLDHEMDSYLTKMQQMEHEINLLTAVNAKQTDQIRHVRDMSVVSMVSAGGFSSLASGGGDEASALLTQIALTLDDNFEENDLDALTVTTSAMMTPLGESTAIGPGYDGFPDAWSDEEAEGGEEGEGEDGESAKTAAEKKGLTIDVRDVIKEYLYLTATAVMFKFPGLNDKMPQKQLIEKAKHRPFYQLHDYMVSIMKSVKNKAEAEKRAKQLSATDAKGERSRRRRSGGGRRRRRKSRSMRSASALPSDTSSAPTRAKSPRSPAHTVAGATASMGSDSGESPVHSGDTPTAVPMPVEAPKRKAKVKKGRSFMGLFKRAEDDDTEIDDQMPESDMRLTSSVGGGSGKAASGRLSGKVVGVFEVVDTVKTPPKSRGKERVRKKRSAVTTEAPDLNSLSTPPSAGKGKWAWGGSKKKDRTVAAATSSGASSASLRESSTSSAHDPEAGVAVVDETQEDDLDINIDDILSTFDYDGGE